MYISRTVDEYFSELENQKGRALDVPPAAVRKGSPPPAFLEKESPPQSERKRTKGTASFSSNLPRHREI